MSNARLSVSGAILSFAIVAAISGCRPDRAVEPGGDAIPATAPILVSSPSIAADMSGGNGNAGVSDDTHAYVSASPGSVVALTVAISNRTRERRSGTSGQLEAPVIDGGFDPVSVPASPGDTLQLEFRALNQSVFSSEIVVVPRLSPPAIVRTNPRGGKRDVPLNVRLQIIFSEPVNFGTVGPDNVSITAGGIAIPGTLLQTNEFTVEFTPAELLRPETSYEITVHTGLLSAHGVGLPNDFTATFETASASSPVTASSCGGGSTCFAFVREGAVFTTALDGSPEARVIEDATSPMWSPDGSKIAFTRSQDHQLNKWQVCVANADGTDVRCAVGENDGAVIGGPSWSPDGAYVAFSYFTYSCPNGQCGQYGGYESGVTLLDTRSMKVTTVGTQPVGSLAWSPDGRKIAYGQFPGGALYLMNPDGSNVQSLGPLNGPGAVQGIAWSPDSRRLALALDDETHCPWYCDTALGVVNANGTGLQVLARGYTSFPGKASDRYIASPAWSADGLQIAYTLIADCYESDPGCSTDVRAWNLQRGESYVIVPNAGAGSWR